MRRIEIEARGNGNVRDGAQVVLLLEGLAHLEQDARFFLRPLDAVARGDEIGELSEDQQAAAVRVVEGGVEITIAAEVTRHPALIAGTAVEIEFPDAQVWSEFNWPDIPRPATARRVTTSTERQAAPTRPVEAAARPSAPVTPPLDHGNHSGAVKSPAVAGAARSARSGGTVSASKDIANGASMSSPQFSEFPVGETSASAEGQQHAASQEYVVFYPHARGGKLATPTGDGHAGSRRRAKSLLPSTRGGAAVMAVAAVLALQGVMWAGTSGQTGSAPGSAPASTSLQAESAIYDLFAGGPVSPRGVQARDTTALKALENAQAALLTPGAPRDVDEGAFWLRRFITSGGSDERTRRVLTQLGTAYADSTNRPAEYGKAKQVWELASTFGDPVAMCFLGTLYENGLGTASDRRLALQWYERSKQAGGCPSVDELIARVKK